MVGVVEGEGWGSLKTFAGVSFLNENKRGFGVYGFHNDSIFVAGVDKVDKAVSDIIW